MDANTSRHEADEVAAACRRMMRGLVRRAAEGDTFALEALGQLEDELPTATAVALELMSTGVRMDLNRPPYSFTELGAVLGTSRQAARQRVTGPKATRLLTGAARWFRQPKGVKGDENSPNAWCLNVDHQDQPCRGDLPTCWQR